MSRVSWATVVVAMYTLSGQLFLTYTHADEHVQQLDGSTVDDGQQVIIRIQLIEINRSKMRRLGFDFVTVEDGGTVHQYKTADSIFGFKGKENISGLFSSPQVIGFLDALCQNGIARVLAEPNIAVIDGRSASFCSGSTVEIGGPQHANNDHDVKFIGTKLDVVPHLVKNNRVHIELRLDYSCLDKTANNGGIAVPKVHHRGVNTRIEANLGETITLGGLLSKVRTGEQTEEVELVLMVTPDIVDGKHTSNQPTVRVGQAISSIKAKQ